MFHKTLRVFIPVIIVLLLTACGLQGLGTSESETLSTQGNTNPHIVVYEYLPVEAPITCTPGNNEYTGVPFFIHIYPFEYGVIGVGNSENYVYGYAAHAEDESYSSIAIGGIPTLDSWGDIFNTSNGFLVAFTYIGYSETYNVAYGLYISHEPVDQFSQYESIYSDYCTCEDASHTLIVEK